MEGRTNERLIDEYGKELLELYKSTLSIAPIGGESVSLRFFSD